MHTFRHVPLPTGTCYISELHPQQPKLDPLGNCSLTITGHCHAELYIPFSPLFKQRSDETIFHSPSGSVSSAVNMPHLHLQQQHHHWRFSLFHHRSLPEAIAGFAQSKIMCLPLIPFPDRFWPCWCRWPAPWVMERVTPREQDNENKMEFEILHVSGCAK